MCQALVEKEDYSIRNHSHTHLGQLFHACVNAKVCFRPDIWKFMMYQDEAVIKVASIIEVPGDVTNIWTHTKKENKHKQIKPNQLL